LAAQERGEFVLAVVQAATSRDKSEPWLSAVPCIAQRGRRRCKSAVQVHQSAPAVEWSCPACGESGVVTHFESSAADLSRYWPRGKTVPWGFDHQERAVLWTATTHIPELRAIVARAETHGEIEGLLWLRATVAELNEIYTLVEELTDGTRSRRRIELLDGLRATLCTSIDGF